MNQTIFRQTCLAASAILLAADPAAAANRTAVFAGGCYWSMEHDIKAVPGVAQVTSGFAAYPPGLAAEAHARAPLHFEAVRVAYDPARISYADLVARYLRVTDPTDAGGQFCDRGPDYRTAIFTSDATEAASAHAAIAAAQKVVKRPIVTLVLAAAAFKAAPMDQQDWARKNVARYAAYRQGCGKDRTVQAVWGGR